MEGRNEDQPYPERETARNDDEAGKRARDGNLTPSPHGGASAEGGEFDRSPETPPRKPSE
jgi:hypothetical protein